MGDYVGSGAPPTVETPEPDLPSLSEVQHGLEEILSDAVGSSVEDEIIEEIAACVAPQIMGLDQETLEAIADGKDEATASDAPILQSITKACAEDADY